MKESRLGVGEFLDLAFKNIVPVYRLRYFMVVLGSAKSRSYILGIVIFEEEISGLLQRFIRFVIYIWIGDEVHVHDYGRRILRATNRGAELLERKIFSKWQICGFNEKQGNLESWRQILTIMPAHRCKLDGEIHQGISHIYLILYCIVFLLKRMNGCFNNRGFEDCRGRIIPSYEVQIPLFN